MKKIIASVLMLLLGQQLSAETLYDQLCRFNFNWKKYALQKPQGEAISFRSDKEYIQTHLKNVLVVLRSNPTENLNAQQLQSRTHLIDVLAAYREAGIFPKNLYRRERLPVFIDEFNTHCAVGFLMRETGHENLAQRIAAADNYVWVKDIHDPELLVWQNASGFTVEELKLIQGAYDSYMENAFFLPNKYEIPQKPATMLVYFENEALHKSMPEKTENIWCKGEGVNGVLNGRWEQNYAVGIPWIVGYYENGKRTGQWQEYYQGTKKLCRTENWRNDKLNGIRKRFDRFGNLIEEILFRDGKAIKKTNYSLEDSLTWIRKPLDSNMVYTEVFNAAGTLIAMGNEKVYNPGNLQWFQNIELTALNMAAVQTQAVTQSDKSIYYKSDVSSSIFPRRGRLWSYEPPLVTYEKEGTWKYYGEYNYATRVTPNPTISKMVIAYPHFGQEFINAAFQVSAKEFDFMYDSIQVDYIKNQVQHLYGYAPQKYLHLQISYYKAKENPNEQVSLLHIYPFQTIEPFQNQVHYVGQFNQKGERIGEWKYYTRESKVYKTENYMIAWKEEEDAKKSDLSVSGR
jgi:antitoxin component YwqK of YwqJK toxin-antitoxin module